MDNEERTKWANLIAAFVVGFALSTLLGASLGLWNIAHWPKMAVAITCPPSKDARAVEFTTQSVSFGVIKDSLVIYAPAEVIVRSNSDPLCVAKVKIDDA